MVNSIYAFIWIAALWKWGDWKNWRKYYSTFLFFVIGDLLYLYLLSDIYPMWRYSPPEVDESIGITHTHVAFSVMLVKYPSTILIYLSNFPVKNKQKQLLYMLSWVVLYAVNEIIDLKFDLIQYHNGWNLWWSILFNLVMFSILYVHFRKPVLAWIFAGFYIVILWNVFNVPSNVFR
ncbi:CBO0543 family protein [Aquibacillus kalidii]|uniref:CBO0543 family protein n=1 Tax=Aquibacillus kalidii TaxID=2762597 RepID=UPI001648FCE6|nr:CBO0543 family protein [Aquibacillus kalidii]